MKNPVDAMSKGMRFDVEWRTAEGGATAEQAAFAELRLEVGGHVLTEVYDTIGKTVRLSARLSVLSLGRWLASNWWRLCWERLWSKTRTWERH